MPGSASTWRNLKRLPRSWTPPPPLPDGKVPVKGDLVVRRGVLEGKVVLTLGAVFDVYPRKANSCTFFRWLAKVLWSDGTETQIRVEKLLRRRDYWLQVAEGKKVWL